MWAYHDQRDNVEPTTTHTAARSDLTKLSIKNLASLYGLGVEDVDQLDAHTEVQSIEQEHQGHITEPQCAENEILHYWMVSP